ncbi:CGNR zinc finger domain-containing protein [Kitasatospora sp. NBC_01560]|uniref:CGNR zinc finger domain-containing protein n=1 Tax=Kitasatospora sp. NBC_01560 TaxID=2975965 RepID=UPI00386805EA
MAAITDTDRFRQGSGRLCLDFLRTLRHRGRPDAAEELTDPAALAAWVRQFAPRPGRPDRPAAAPGPAEVAAARDLREAVHRLIGTARGASGPDGPDGARGANGTCGTERGHGGGNGHHTDALAGFDRTDADRINRAAAHPAPTPELDPAGHLTWHADDPVAATLALVARDALDLATSAAATRVRECAGPDCCALFLDNSRPGTRRWCSMDICGNRAKKAALRGRAATAGA